jgi:RNA polymerase sigma factor (sigma-70 family)
MKFHLNSSEHDLVKGCVKGDNLAQKYLYQKFYSKMLNVCMRYSNDRDEAAEMLNMGFLKVFNSIGKFSNKGSLEGWIRRIVVNTSIDHIRKYQTYNKTMVHDSYTEGAVENEAMDHMLGEEILEVIQKIPPCSRNVFCLYLIEGYTHKEISEKLGISIGTSKWHLSEGKKRFRDLAAHFETELAKVG